MPVLPIIDLLILSGWSTLFAALVLKLVWFSTSYRPLVMGLGPFDLVVIAATFLLFALALTGRTWVKAHEAQLALDAAAARAAATLHAYEVTQEGVMAEEAIARAAGGGSPTVGIGSARPVRPGG